MLEFRSHHFFCTLGFEGKGYSPEFVRGFQRIADALRAHGDEGDRIEIRVVADTDSICEPCPNRRGTLCETEDKIRKLDGAHARILGLKPGDVLSWKEARRRLAERMSVEDHHEACAPCSWRAMGVCEKALLAEKARWTREPR